MRARPNILILHTDQQRYDSLGCMGNTYARTPNLDRLAAEGSLFTRHISSNTICMPSRASLLTGLYPPGHGVWTNGVALNRREYATVTTQSVGADVRPEPPTAADVFAAAGYDTVAFGKLHLTPNLAPPEYGYPETWARWDDGDLDDWHGPYYGFRHVEMTQGHGEQPCHRGHYAAWLQAEHPDVYAAVVRNAQDPERPVPALRDLYRSAVPAEFHNSTWLANRFCDYLENRPPDRPFFAFVGFPDPHHPFTPSSESLELFEGVDVQASYDPTGEGIRHSPVAQAGTDISGLTMEERRTILRHTYAMVYQIDQAVGQVMDGLKRAGLWETTVIVFTSDHGDFLGDHARLRKGFTPSDALLHLPFILRAPGVGLPSHVHIPMSNVDVMPTLTALAGVSGPSWVHGTDIPQVVLEGQDHAAFAYCANGDPAMTNYTVYDDAHRFTLYPHTGYAELFDYREDPGEIRNLAADRPHLVDGMRRAVEQALLNHRNPILCRVSAW